MQLEEPITAAGWRAELALGFERRGERTVLAQRRHEGPLVVQKPLYPEGGAVCHAIVVHPPGGIAGGDELRLEVAAGENAAALLTTPGASKWYRSAGPLAKQSLSFDVRGALEWLPQEAIVFDGALADLSTEIRLAGEASCIAWEVLCLGRTGSGERFQRGACRLSTEVRRDGKLLWLERGRIEGGGALLESAAGFGGRTVLGTMLAAAPGLTTAIVNQCRKVAPEPVAITLLPGVLVARYLGDSSEEAKHSFGRIWAVLRPALLAREAVEPRIWRT